MNDEKVIAIGVSIVCFIFLIVLWGFINQIEDQTMKIAELEKANIELTIANEVYNKTCK